MKEFKWTDESVKAFTNVYSGNYNETTPSMCSYKRYKGLKMDEKLALFKTDWTAENSK